MHKAHDADYRAAKKDWDSFVDSFTEKVIEKDETIPELPAKDLVRESLRQIQWPQRILMGHDRAGLSHSP